MTAPPAPMTHDAFYEKQADRLRLWMAERRDPAIVRISVPSSWSLASDRFEERVLICKRAVGPAPYVGRSFMYEWPIMVDDEGHYVAGEARLTYTETPFAYWIRTGDGSELPTRCTPPQHVPPAATPKEAAE